VELVLTKECQEFANETQHIFGGVEVDVNDLKPLNQGALQEKPDDRRGM
jgi:hypothetical protein